MIRNFLFLKRSFVYFFVKMEFSARGIVHKLHAGVPGHTNGCSQKIDRFLGEPWSLSTFDNKHRVNKARKCSSFCPFMFGVSGKPGLQTEFREDEIFKARGVVLKVDIVLDLIISFFSLGRPLNVLGNRNSSERASIFAEVFQESS